MEDLDIRDDLRKTIGDVERRLLDYEQSSASLVFKEAPLTELITELSKLRFQLKSAERMASAALAHAIEGLLADPIASKQTLSRELVDTILGALDVLSEGLHEAQEPLRRIDAASFRIEAQRTASQAATLASGRRQVFPFRLESHELDRGRLAQAEGARPLIVQRSVPRPLDLDGYNRLQLFETLRKLGRIIAIRPPHTQIPPTSDTVTFTILIATALAENTVRSILEGEHQSTEWSEFWPKTDGTTGATRTAAEPLQHSAFEFSIHRNTHGISPKIPVTDSVSLRLSKLPTDSRSRRILITEDEFVSRQLLLALLGTFGACDVAVDGREAVAAVVRALQERMPYGVICLDIMMPDMDGHQALESIRAAEAHAGLGPMDRSKIVMTTALSDYENFHRAYEGSCDSYIVKPISKAVLMRQLRRIGIEPLI